MTYKGYLVSGVRIYSFKNGSITNCKYKWANVSFQYTYSVDSGFLIHGLWTLFEWVKSDFAEVSE